MVQSVLPDNLRLILGESTKTSLLHGMMCSTIQNLMLKAKAQTQTFLFLSRRSALPTRRACVSKKAITGGKCSNVPSAARGEMVAPSSALCFFLLRQVLPRPLSSSIGSLDQVIQSSRRLLFLVIFVEVLECWHGAHSLGDSVPLGPATLALIVRRVQAGEFF